MGSRTPKPKRLVRRTISGKTHQVEKTIPVIKTKLPTDWDAVALRGIQLMTWLAVLGAMTWSTVSIGSLLSMIAPAWVAYIVAGVFDLAWVVCMVLEWLCRYDPERAAVPRRAGYGALAISMALITTHGHMLEHVEVGIGGALVSAIAKALWSVVMYYSAVELSEEDQGWLRAERGEINSELALTAGQRQLTRTRGKIQKERLALMGDVHLVYQTQDMLPPVLPVSSETRKTVVGHVSRVMDIPEELLQDSPGTPDTRPVPGHQDRAPSVSSFVLDLLTRTPDTSGTDIRTAVRSRFGQDTGEANIAKAITRARNAIKNTPTHEETGR